MKYWWTSRQTTLFGVDNNQQKRYPKVKVPSHVQIRNYDSRSL